MGIRGSWPKLSPGARSPIGGIREVIELFSAIIIRSVCQEFGYSALQRRSRADIWFTDGSRLVAQEFNYFDTGRTKYGYQWVTPENQTIIRWDNAHEVPGIATSPFHQHVGLEENVLPSEPMTLEKVLTFISHQLTSD